MAETFGKTTKGLEEQQGANNRIRLCKFESGSAGNLQSISAYIKYVSGGLIKCAIYNADKSLVANGTTEEKTVELAQDDWMVFNFGATKPSVAASTDYWLAIWLQLANYYYRDAGETEQMGWDDCTYNSWPDPWVVTGLGDYEYSFYATYEEAPPAKKTLVQATLTSIPPIVLPTLREILRLTGS